ELVLAGECPTLSFQVLRAPGLVLSWWVTSIQTANLTWRWLIPIPPMFRYFWAAAMALSVPLKVTEREPCLFLLRWVTSMATACPTWLWQMIITTESRCCWANRAARSCLRSNTSLGAPTFGGGGRLQRRRQTRSGGRRPRRHWQR